MNESNSQSLLKNALVNISGPNPGDAKGEDEHAAESAAMSFHSQPSMSPEIVDPANISAIAKDVQRKIGFGIEIKNGEEPNWRRN